MRTTRAAIAIVGLCVVGALPLRRDRLAQGGASLAAGLIQNQGAASQPQMPGAGGDPPGTIDGAKNPELIPDDVAYRLVFLAIAEPEEATDTQKIRARAKIAPAGLSEEDTDALLHILAAFQKQENGLDAQAGQIQALDPFPSPSSSDGQQLIQLGQERQQALADAMNALPARMSPAGVAQLQAYVQDAKLGMKLVPDSATPPN